MNTSSSRFICANLCFSPSSFTKHIIVFGLEGLEDLLATREEIRIK